MSNAPPPAVLATPYTPQDLADFEVLIFASNADDPAVRLPARVNLSAFIKRHSRAKCDMMMVELSKFHDKPQRPDA